MRLFSPLVWSLIAVAVSAVLTLLPSTDGLPDPIVLFAIPLFWPVAPFSVLLISSWALTFVALAGSIASLAATSRRWSGAVGVAARTLATVPVGILVPSAFWQLGMTSTPDRDELASTPAFMHGLIAVLVVGLPLGISGVRAAVAPRTYGLALRAGQVPAEVAPEGVARMFNTLTARLDPAAARIMAVNIMGHLRAQNARQPPQTYQFRMPNGAFLTIDDRYLGDQRRLFASGKVPAGYRNIYGVIGRPRAVAQEAPWFSWPVEGSTERKMARWCVRAFNRQDDSERAGAIVLDPAVAADPAS